MKFDLEINNPPFQDTESRGKTQHKLWIDFLIHSEKTLKEGGILAYVTPDSFSSPSSKVLEIMKTNKTKFICYDSKKYFQEEGNDPGSSFAHYIIEFNKSNNDLTRIVQNGKEYVTDLNQYLYIPNDFCEESAFIHKNVIFDSIDKLDVKFDYVTCHNVNLKKNGLNSHVQKNQTVSCVYPLLHTNIQIWYSSIRQDFADLPKVMWSRSGYTKPFFDNGVLGCTDMGYYVLVEDEEQGNALSHNLNTKLFKYIFKTARWSGFGNEVVFRNLPKLPLTSLTDKEMYNHFKIPKKMQKYIDSHVR